MADYKTPQWLLPNEKNLAYPAAGAGVTGSGLSEDRHSLYSMDFNGTDYISAPNTFLNSASVCTLSFWMKGTGEVGGGAPWNGIQIQAGVSTTSFRTMNGSNVNNYVSFSPGTDWHHYLGVYVGGSYSKLYIDGVLKSTLSTGIPATLASTSGDIFKIGYGQSYSVAKIDEVAIWNRQLTDGGVADGVTAGGEIATIYNSGAPGNLMALSAKPTAYYPLGEQAQMGSANWSFPNGSLQSHVIEFDGTSDYITTPSFTTSGDDLTISVWLKAVNLSSGTSDILFGNNSNFIRYNLNEVIYARINGVDAYLIANSGGVPQIFGTGNWHHLAVVKSGSTVTWYIDGNPYTTLGSGTTGGFTMNYIGANGSALNEFLDGQLSNVAIWNSDQSANIANIYNNGSPQSTYTVTPTAWWKLNAANSSYDTATSTWAFIDTETPAPNYTSALDFDGALIDGININNDSSLEPSTSFTLSCWIKSETSQNFYAYPVYKESLDSSHVAYGFYLQGSSTIATTVTTNGVITSDNIGDLRDGKWHHVVQTYDGSGMKVYLDGVQSGTTKSITGNVVYSATSTELYIGNTRRTSPSGYFSFKGNISNVALFNTAIDAAGVSTLFNSGTPQTSISYSPTSWWKLDNITTGIQDSVGSNNGTITGSVTQIATNVLISNDGTSTTLPSTALVTSDLQFESPYSNYSLSFDGTSNFIDCGNAFTQTGAFSVSAWIKTSTTSATSVLYKSGVFQFGKDTWYNGGVGGAPNLSLTDSGGITKLFRNGIAPSGATVTVGTVVDLKDGNWHNIAFTYDGVNQGKYYSDGIMSYTYDITDASWAGTLASNSNDLLIGKTTLVNWNGNIDEVAVWGSNLTQAQISQVYNNGYPADLTSLSPSQWWRLGEDAYFVGNDITIPNKITSGPTGTGSGTQTAILVGNAPGSYANGSGTNLVVTDRIGDAPESTANSVSINMIPSNRHSYTAGYVPTQVNNTFSMDFDGVDDYFDLGTGLDIFRYNINESYSVSLWYKTTSSAADKTIINLGANTYKFTLASASSGKITFGAGNSSTITVTYNWLPTAGAINDGAWHHICIVQDSSGGVPNLTAYVDGSSSGSGIGTTFITQTNNRIGNGHYGGVEAGIDEVALFNYALSERQIKQDIYKGTTAGGKTADLNNISNLTAPIAWYRMGD